MKILKIALQPREWDTVTRGSRRYRGKAHRRLTACGVWRSHVSRSGKPYVGGQGITLYSDPTKNQPLITRVTANGGNALDGLGWLESELNLNLAYTDRMYGPAAYAAAIAKAMKIRSGAK